MSKRDEILSIIPDAAHNGILKMALDHEISDPNDPLWTMVALAYVASTSVDMSRASLAAVDKHTQDLPSAIYQATIKAAIELKASIANEIQTQAQAMAKTVSVEIDRSAKAGAEGLKAASADLVKMAQNQGPGIVEGWKVQLAQAASLHAKMAIKAQAKASLLWATLIIAGCLSLGFAGGIGYLATTNKITPPGTSSYFNAGEIVNNFPASPTAAWFNCPTGNTPTCISISRDLFTGYGGGESVSSWMLHKIGL